jgi:hypothetical protein
MFNFAFRIESAFATSSNGTIEQFHQSGMIHHQYTIRMTIETCIFAKGAPDFFCWRVCHDADLVDAPSTPPGVLQGFRPARNNTCGNIWNQICHRLRCNREE